ncbi:hypothetical protein HWV62_41571 [Athelia sp. TMB]|nr:hypothetical protein HWV62_41571 [Athelia sp. TMB]
MVSVVQMNASKNESKTKSDQRRRRSPNTPLPAMASLDNLPTELLIVLFALAATQDPLLPLSLAALSRRLRAIVIGSPEIWTHIPLSDDPPSPPALAELWLARSHPLPFDAHVQLAQADAPALLGLLAPLLAHLPRWRSYTASGTTVRIDELIPGSAPALHYVSLALGFQPGLGPFYACGTPTHDPHHVSLALSVPALPSLPPRVTLPCVALDIAAPHSSQPLDPRALLALLRAAPALEELYLAGALLADPPDDYCEDEAPVAMAHLWLVRVRSTTLQRAILPHIRAPRLRELWLQHLNVDFVLPPVPGEEPADDPPAPFVDEGVQPGPLVAPAVVDEDEDEEDVEEDTTAPAASSAPESGDAFNGPHTNGVLQPPIPTPDTSSSSSSSSSDSTHPAPADFSRSPHSDLHTGSALRLLLAPPASPASTPLPGSPRPAFAPVWEAPDPHAHALPAHAPAPAPGIALEVLEMDLADLRAADFAWLFARLPRLRVFRLSGSDMGDGVLRGLLPHREEKGGEEAGEGAGEWTLPLPRLEHLELRAPARLTGPALAEVLVTRVRFSDARAAAASASASPAPTPLPGIGGSDDALYAHAVRHGRQIDPSSPAPSSPPATFTAKGKGRAEGDADGEIRTLRTLVLVECALGAADVDALESAFGERVRFMA